MKYIRTKDGKISYLDAEPYEDEPNYVVITSKGKLNFYRPDQVIKQADTIKELCDELVLMSELEKRIIKPQELNKDCEGWTKEIGIPEGMIKVYGAIWTSKGLIYVAKMNEKGELELL